MIKAVFFDWDQTLISSYDVVKQWYVYLKKKYGYKNTGMSMKWIFAHTTDEVDNKFLDVNLGLSAQKLMQLNKKFDLIFIDGDHSTEAVRRDTKKMFSYLNNDQSIIVWHDAKVDTEYPRYEVLLGIYQALPYEMHGNIYLVENSLCAVYIPM